MADENAITVEGFKELKEKLDTLDTKLATKIIRQMLRAGAKITYSTALTTVPVRTGALRNALKVRAGKAKRGYASVSVQIGEQWFRGDQFYGAFVEFGHRLGSRKLGNARRSVPGEHYLKYAFEESKFAAVETMLNVARTLIESAVKEQSGGTE